MLMQQFNDAGIIKLPQTTPSAVADVAIEDIDADDENENDYLSDYSAKKLSLKLEQKSDRENEQIETTKPQATNLIAKKPINLVPAKKSSNKIFKLNEVTLDYCEQFDSNSLQTLLSQTNARIFEAEG